MICEVLQWVDVIKSKSSKQGVINTLQYWKSPFTNWTLEGQLKAKQ